MGDMLRRSAQGLVMLMAAGTAAAGQVEIVHARFQQAGDAWQVSVTLRHGDTGWEHYADGWRVVDTQGQVLGTRTLYHPHVDEQPFTRSQSGIYIPGDLEQVIVRAGCNVHGFGGKEMVIELYPDTKNAY